MRKQYTETPKPRHRGGDAIHAGATAPRPLPAPIAYPLPEPYARYGPFVMNTREEIAYALLDLREGTFVKG